MEEDLSDIPICEAELKYYFLKWGSYPDAYDRAFKKPKNNLKSLSPLRHDYPAKKMTLEDHNYLFLCYERAYRDWKFVRLYSSAQRLGRLYTLGFITYDVIGVGNPYQPLRLTRKGIEYVREHMRIGPPLYSSWKPDSA
jgi:hypothetical protein